jgi:hypothetical protein
VNFTQYSRIFHVISGMSGSCGWAGIRDVGCATQQSADGSFVASASWLVSSYFSNRDQAVKLTTHEGGRALGLLHAQTRDFGVEALGAPGTAGTINQYGDIFSSMGYWSLGHYAAPHKAKLGWLSAPTVTSNGSFAVQPAEIASPVQASKIRRGSDNNNWLWLEYRSNLGLYDSTLPSQVFSGALIHYQDSSTGLSSQLLDYTTWTSSFSDPALVGPWLDTYTNTTVDMNSVTSAGLGVNVAYGPAPCVTTAPSVMLSPTNPSIYAGETASYSVSVFNNDSSSRSSRSFDLTSLLPNTWPTTFSQSSLVVLPASSASASMRKTAPAGTSPATYVVDADAISGSTTTVGTANLTVKPPLVPISVTLSVPAGSYTNGSMVSITATVLQGTAGASGAYVNFTLVEANGAVVRKKLSTDSNGKSVWSYRVGPKDPKGAYTVNAQATFGSQSAKASTVSFTVQ